VRKTSGNQKLLKCSCLAILNTAGDLTGDIPTNLYQKAVAHFQLYFGELKKYERQRKVMDWIRYGRMTQIQPFLLPYLAPPNTDMASLKDIDAHRICISALMSLLGIGYAWSSTCHAVSTCHAFVKEGVMPMHGLCGKQSNRKRKFAEEEEADLQAFMDNLKQFAEPSATRFVREATGQIEIRDTDDDTLYFGSSWMQQDCYKQYCHERGYQVETSSVGIIKLIAIGLDPDAEEKKSCIAWPTFYNYWKREYPKLRVSKPAEDICGQCYIFCNQHKFCSQTNANENDSDDDKSNDDGGDGAGNHMSGGDNDDIPISSTSDNENAEEMTEDEMMNLTSKMDGENDAAPPGLTADYEEKVLEAAEHVKAAKSQRQLFNEKIANAREDVNNNVPHNIKRHCYVIDYYQLMTLPVFWWSSTG
jgi:hypothetical protein